MRFQKARKKYLHWRGCFTLKRTNITKSKLGSLKVVVLYSKRRITILLSYYSQQVGRSLKNKIIRGTEYLRKIIKYRKDEDSRCTSRSSVPSLLSFGVRCKIRIEWKIRQKERMQLPKIKMSQDVLWMF